MKHNNYVTNIFDLAVCFSPRLKSVYLLSWILENLKSSNHLPYKAATSVGLTSEVTLVILKHPFLQTTTSFKGIFPLTFMNNFFLFHFFLASLTSQSPWLALLSCHLNMAFLQSSALYPIQFSLKGLFCWNPMYLTPVSLVPSSPELHTYVQTHNVTY